MEEILRVQEKHFQQIIHECQIESRSNPMHFLLKFYHSIFNHLQFPPLTWLLEFFSCSLTQWVVFIYLLICIENKTKTILSSSILFFFFINVCIWKKNIGCIGLIRPFKDQVRVNRFYNLFKTTHHDPIWSDLNPLRLNLNPVNPTYLPGLVKEPIQCA